MTNPATPNPVKREYVHPDAHHAKKKKKPSPFPIKPISAFYVFLASAAASALYSPIADCDETFNYWEPAHYLSHGYGLQTWEYSPEFAIRDWGYISMHTIVSNFRRIMPFPTKVAEFYFVRYALCFVYALTQTIFYRTITLTLNGRVGIIYVIASVFSPGYFHAATAFLPSSFAMYTTILGTNSFMNWRGGLHTSQGMFWFAIGAVFGWPFAYALMVPFIAEELILAIISSQAEIYQTFLRLVRGAVSTVLLVGLDTSINWFFYRELFVLPWNIVKYNIFSSSGGPDLYGTEPWNFYTKNLLLNFNIWFVLALACFPVFALHKLFWPSVGGVQSGLRTLVFMTPFYMWLGIFTLQPHKEERFMYPAYPLLVLNAAMTTHMVLSISGNPKGIFALIPAKIKALGVVAVFLLSINVSVMRIYGIYSAYAAPMEIYAPLGTGALHNKGIGQPGEFVCFAKEWYRFPSSYFLPRNMRPKFVRSEFRGLLPGEFSEADVGFGAWPTWMPTSGFNDLNQEDPSKYTDIKACGFLVDTHYPLNTDPLPPLEPDYVSDKENWEIVTCQKFLDTARTHPLARILYVPNLNFVPDNYRRKWGEHCLLRRKN
ncbi:mannosyltransferase [Ceratocystis pirilliformis]|uniref:Mannosyltransferase n=1 Tax=Ceratocystis pirilliformis TaxID=259994 RepID=A0ABR3YHB6_9PEZI